ncbi:dihydrodipicolinate reductase [Buchnera aphidicola (Nipponaphis monzeni)]|uniref:4-hydroxy-tetrahydrodipicolinate reductase n=1 Tax=Buchnera aphidicola (Nipponaphis monzeni) TaxID=2495405 RepID=A0A455T9X5_9GAMM|nr:4-hydroxy-tetrahydrodipicolinate reductase [Buchnera aphidicola]BBI01131.1 dihydrodipicolinate reductase [Buchnera aphidicola (Nipponaphis monzeni)]
MNNQNLKIAVTGALGRMGSLLIKEILKKKNIILSLAIVKNKSSVLHFRKQLCIKNKNVNFIICDSLKHQNKKFDILIDFSQPSASMKYLEYCVQHNKHLIIGTTGFNTIENETIKLASKKISIIQSSNFSIGINLIFNLLKDVTSIMSNNSDIEIIESHHRNKVDAPSGTAIEMGKIISKIMKIELDNNSIYHRVGNVGVRPNKKIGFSSIRAGNIIGEHTVMFANNDEEVLITHKAINRLSFIKGVIKAALWLPSQKNGLFNMKHVLNIQ